MTYYKDIGKVKFEGSKSKNPFSFKYYNKDEIVLGKKMKDHFNFAMAYWHTMVADGSDPFGSGTMQRPWDDKHTDLIDRAKERVHVGFEIMEILGLEYFCFHDRDIAPEGKSLMESNHNLDVIVDVIASEMKRTGLKLLWGTANLFNNKRFVHGAGTSPNADIFAYSAAQLKKAIELTHRLNGKGFVFWGGREGYETLLNTDMSFEQDNFARLLKMAISYAREIGFKGEFYIEPKPKEPMKHQYDFDAANVVAFLRKYDLINEVKLNLETNHATLAGHTMQHEIRYAADNGVLGSIDANQGDLLLGWDTDQFPTNIMDAVLIMYEIIRAGGVSGGFNFDAKVRRGSFTKEDLLLAHIAGMDTFAAGLKIAAKLYEDGVIEDFINERYKSYQQGIGKAIVENQVDLQKLEAYILEKEELEPNQSGRQELLEMIINQYILG